MPAVGRTTARRTGPDRTGPEPDPTPRPPPAHAGKFIYPSRHKRAHFQLFDRIDKRNDGAIFPPASETRDVETALLFFAENAVIHLLGIPGMALACAMFSRMIGR